MKLLGLLTLFIYVVCLSANSLRAKYVYDFGFDTGVVSFAQSGHIGFFEKSITVPVVVPICSQLTYVRVEVNDFISQPSVTFDVRMSSVIIKFQPWQYSKSSYVVTAKSIPDDRFCTEKMRHVQRPTLYRF